MAKAPKTVVYGIPNCDTVKKARVWLEEHGVEFEFHDFKKLGVSNALVQDWLKDVSVDLLINKKLKFHGNIVSTGRKRAFLIEKPYLPGQ